MLKWRISSVAIRLAEGGRSFSTDPELFERFEARDYAFMSRSLEDAGRFYSLNRLHRQIADYLMAHRLCRGGRRGRVARKSRCHFLGRLAAVAPACMAPCER